jgi:hypothetical protein
MRGLGTIPESGCPLDDAAPFRRPVLIDHCLDASVPLFAIPTVGTHITP